MPSMSYCMFENTVGEMKQVVDAMEDAQSWSRLDIAGNEYERESFFTLMRLCAKFLGYANEMFANEDDDVAAIEKYTRAIREIKFETELDLSR